MTDPSISGNEPVQMNVDPLKKEMTLNSQCAYANRGFMTLQSMMGRYLICKADTGACSPRQRLTRQEPNSEVGHLEFLVGLGSGGSSFGWTAGVIEPSTDAQQRIVAPEQYPPQDVQVTALPIRPSLHPLQLLRGDCGYVPDGLYSGEPYASVGHPGVPRD
jgi:hypothetical protein